MFLNKDKSVIIGMNCISDVRYKDGNLVKQVDRTKYLGVIIDEKAERKYELEYRLSNAKDAAIKLRNFGDK